ncbi:MAG: thioredoxin family protein [Ignavibacteria bacterium]
MNRLLIFSLLFVVTLQAQNKSRMVTDEKSGGQMLTGISDRPVFSDTTFSWWFNSEYEGYKVKIKDLDGVKEKIKDFDITIVMAAWCGDSRREIPRFYKILDSLEYPSDKIKLIMVDRKKKDPSGEADSLKIRFIPTIIFYNGKTEAGRIIEAPKETLETDIHNIIFGTE